jgi:hypothetical protein
VRALFEEANSVEETAEKDRRFGIMERKMATTAAHALRSQRDDPYGNGIIGQSLHRRYRVELSDEDYPHINSLLGMTKCLADVDPKKPPGENCGNGYFRFTIV